MLTVKRTRPEILAAYSHDRSGSDREPDEKLKNTDQKGKEKKELEDRHL